MTNEHLDSLDATLAAARTAWEVEKKSLLDRIFALETENALFKGIHSDAIKARSAAENFATKLLTQFAVVGHVFEEARTLALSSGVDVEGEAAKAVTAAKALIDSTTSSASSTTLEVPHVPT